MLRLEGKAEAISGRLSFLYLETTEEPLKA
jgi:hypothetical protein